ncbi:histidine phosphatase family protein [Corynebacterium kalidii]|uniref:Histidine phosphatase family protein n=1 Tax=Corynebacterium kalidii TaxID=2931982 RepID=A0A9X2B1X8_9CORY|nr:histidine phosphatase family protein [Corynebacterium kalidii]
MAERRATPGWIGDRGDPVRILLLRHGQTAMSAAGVFSGRSDPELTDLGHEQARRAAAYLASRQDAGEGIGRIISSPLTRTRQTAEAAAGSLGLDVDTDENLIETDFGRWEGLTFDEVHRRWPEEHAAWVGDTTVPTLGGESMSQVEDRCSALVEDLAGAGTVLVVSHVSPIKAILRAALQVPSAMYSTLHLDLAGLSVVEFYPGHSMVREVNDTHYLR